MISRKNEADRILIVKLNRLGDTVAFLPAIYALRKGLPKARLTVLTTEIGREVLKGSGLVDEIWVSDINEIKTAGGFFKCLSRVKKHRFNAALASSDTSSFAALLFFLARIPVRIGFSNPRLSLLYTKKIPFRRDFLHGRLNLDLARALGLSIEDNRPLLKISDEAKKSVRQRLLNSGVNGKFVVIHPGSNKPSRRWPIEKFAMLVDLISAEYKDMKVLCIGSGIEKEIVNSIDGRLKRKGSVIDFTGCSLDELSFLMSSTAFFIGHSSGPLHIAYLAGTPTVSLWGASSPLIWGPMWDPEMHSIIKADIDCIHCEKAECSKGSLECMSLITVEEVFKEVERCLGSLWA